MSHMTTDNYRKHTTTNPAQRFLIDNFFKNLLHEAGLLHPESILDVGCGEGFTLDRFHTQLIGKKLVGIDFLDTAITIGKKERPHLDLKKGNIYDIPFSDNSFDLVMCCEVLEHIDTPEKGLQELSRVTKKHCILSVPNEPWFMLSNFLRGKNLSRWGNDVEHIQHWSTNAFVKLVSKYFVVDAIRQPFPWTMLITSKR
ncbi:MAG: class I SAM-dependent methyltransferase [Candidatus Levybacteria bacterium]|nr:class I SAM-dependent methyltransferase [Candidatus Levybacteria bacterium]